MTGPREALTRRLLLAADGAAAVGSAPLRQAAPPALVIAPGRPYIRPLINVPDCFGSWRLDVWCIVGREDVNAQDAQDDLAELVREVAEEPDWQSTDGMVCTWLGAEQGNVSVDDLAGIPGLATIVQLRVDA